MRNHIIIMCTDIEYKRIRYGTQQCALLLYITKTDSYVDGISADMHSFPCWLDVADAESPDCNEFVKSVGQLV